MTSLDQALTETFAGVAQGAPDDFGLLSRVQVATKRRTRSRRVVVLAGGLAAATAVVAVGLNILPGGRTHADRFADPTGFLVDNRSAEKAFPFTPSYLPADVTGDPMLDVYNNYGYADFVPGGVAISYAAAPGSAKGIATTVDGKPGRLSCGGAGPCLLSWRRSATVHVTVQTDSTEAETRRIAEGLRDEPIIQKPKIVLGLLPAFGCHLSLITSSSTVYNPIDGGQACPVSVEVLSRGDAETSVGPVTVIDDPATIGGYTGKLVGYASDTEQFWQATLDLGGGRRLVVRAPQGHGWDRGELDRFVRAIIVP